VKVLIVEDNVNMGAVLRDLMKRERFVADWARSLEDADIMRASAAHDLILLDLSLPDGDGLTFLRSLRAARIHTPVIVLTARAGLNDRIVGLDEGADDYLIKPFELSELVSRCRAVLRRPNQMAAEPIQAGKLQFDLSSHAVMINGAKIELARREQQLLGALMRREGKVCGRAYLESSIYANNADISPNALEVSISRLRTYLQNANAGVEVRTVRGIGYILTVTNHG
jgi:DNA-binding response OmpR family regulator